MLTKPNVKAVVATFNQEKALVGAFSVITNLRMELFQALVTAQAQAQAGMRCIMYEDILYALCECECARSPAASPRATTLNERRLITALSMELLLLNVDVC